MVDQHGTVLDVLVQSRRNAVAANRFFRRLLKDLEYVPRVIVIDKPGQLPGDTPQDAVLDRAPPVEVTEQPRREFRSTARQRKRAMKRFTSPARAAVPVRVQRNLAPLLAPERRNEMAGRFAVWREVTAADIAA
jgi:putative transposase